MEANVLKKNKVLTKKQTKQLRRKETIMVAKANYQLYLILLLPFIWLIIFRYLPMIGVQIAFRDFKAVDGVWGSEWVGFENFIKFFKNYLFEDILRNTILLSVYQLLAGFPFPIILALALNSTQKKYFKKTVQMVTYIPHFISVVVIVGMLMQFTSPRVGIINKFIVIFGGEAVDFLSVPKYFSSLYVWSGVWQSCGWGTIIYLAALAGVDPELHEAAVIDGASRFKRIIHIDFPMIVPTTITMLILRFGHVMNLGFEKIYLMQNSLNRDVSEVISTYVYKVGLASSSADFSYAAAVGLFNAFINLALVIIVNRLAKKFSDTSLW